MTDDLTVEIAVDAAALREEVKNKSREVATDPHKNLPFSHRALSGKEAWIR